MVKRDGRREAFERSKLMQSLRVACAKRPVTPDQLEAIVDRLEQVVFAEGQRELTTSALGERVLVLLRDLDDVAYVRFASVYRSFEHVEEFAAELVRMKAP